MSHTNPCALTTAPRFDFTRPAARASTRRRAATASERLPALVIALWLLGGCREASPTRQVADEPGRGSDENSSSFVPAGTRINVALGSNISSETARVGDVWHGTVTENVMARNESVIPPGSDVDGVVTGVTPARHGSPAILELGVRSIRTNGRDEPIAATSEPVVAGSARARNLGAISGRLASAAPIVLAAGGDGIAAGHVVARPGSHPVVLTDGIVMAFTVSRTAAVRSPGE